MRSQSTNRKQLLNIIAQKYARQVGFHSNILNRSILRSLSAVLSSHHVNYMSDLDRTRVIQIWASEASKGYMIMCQPLKMWRWQGWNVGAWKLEENVQFAAWMGNIQGYMEGLHMGQTSNHSLAWKKWTISKQIVMMMMLSIDSTLDHKNQWVPDPG